MSLLTCVQAAVLENGFGAAPVSVIGNYDALATQCLALAKRAGNVIAGHHDWQNMIQPFSITTVSGQETYDGPMQTDGANSILRFIGNTFWDSTNYLPMQGALNARDWQANKYGLAGTGNARNRKFRVFYGSSSAHGLSQYPKIHITPTPSTDGDVLVLEYVNPGWILAVNFSGLAVADFTSDNDVTLFPEHLLQLSLIWRLRRAKGFDYSEEYKTYEDALSLAIANDSPAPDLNFSMRNSAMFLPNLPTTIPEPV